MTPTPEPFSEPVLVTRPILPPLHEYRAELEDVWDRAWFTNNGPKHARLESELSAYLRAQNVSLFSNGTAALQVGIRALGLVGEVITTPFTFPATPHALAWAGIEPVFCDVHPETLTLDPACIERLITPRTSGILAVHVYGTPCDTEGIHLLANKYSLRVLYDGAHAFGTEVSGRPIASWGDATMFSFHATKMFHTGEGGALISRSSETKEKVDLLKNFGIRNEIDVEFPGINGKMNELQASLGLVVLRHLESERAARLALERIYRSCLANIPGLSVLSAPANVKTSSQYLVVRVVDGGKLSRDALYEKLKGFNVFTRRYFYPLCSDYECYRDLPMARNRSLPFATAAAREVLALPFYGALHESDVLKICSIIEHLMVG